MNSTHVVGLLAFCSLSAALICPEGVALEYPEDLSRDRFEDAIEVFEAQDAESPPPKGGIVVIGSSSVRMWHDTIHEDLAPLTIIPRGFGGSTMLDALHYMDRIVLPYNPRAVVVYEGDNDIALGVEPAAVRNAFVEFVDSVHDSLPDTRIYFLSIKPSISRWTIWPKMKEANGLIAEVCEAHDLLTYVDVSTPMLGEDGEPKEALFLDDMLHLSEAGYALWRDVVRPVLLEQEGTYESDAPRSEASE